jgi:NAD(P)-dependent dehydrogenase (short-subunit alcohol dehydrogenase family)
MIAVVTGGASGIGEACARRFAAQGHSIAILDSNAARATEVAVDLKSSGVTAEAFACDVSDVGLIECLAERIERDLGPVDILIPAAGILQNSETVLDMDVEAQDRLWQVNYHGSLHTARAFGRAMLARRHGAIVFIGSTNSLAPFPLPAYSPSKTAILRLMELLAIEFGRRGVRVNGVAPGYTLTPALKARIESGERDLDIIRKSGAIDMVIEPRHIADAVNFLCSDQAAAITGVMLPVDAGWMPATLYRSYAGGVPWDD